MQKIVIWRWRPWRAGTMTAFATAGNIHVQAQPVLDLNKKPYLTQWEISVGVGSQNNK